MKLGIAVHYSCFKDSGVNIIEGFQAGTGWALYGFLQRLFGVLTFLEGPSSLGRAFFPPFPERVVDTLGLDLDCCAFTGRFSALVCQPGGVDASTVGLGVCIRPLIAPRVSCVSFVTLVVVGRPT